MAFVTVGRENGSDIRLYVEDHGEGRPVVLIHGYPLDGSSWERQTAALLTAGHRVITYDRRGFGASDKPATGYDYDTYTTDLAAILEEREVTGAALVGFSMGAGEVARYLGTYGSGRARSAVVLSGITPSLLQTDDNPEGVPGSVFEPMVQAAKDDRYAFLDGFFENFYNTGDNLGTRLSEPALAANKAIAYRASSTATVEVQRSWLTDFRSDIAKIDVPVLIMHGTADNIVPIDKSARRLHELIPDAEYVEIEGAPHGMLWTHHEEVNAALLPFLAQ